MPSRSSPGFVLIRRRGILPAFGRLAGKQSRVRRQVLKPGIRSGCRISFSHKNEILVGIILRVIPSCADNEDPAHAMVASLFKEAQIAVASPSPSARLRMTAAFNRTAIDQRNFLVVPHHYHKVLDL